MAEQRLCDICNVVIDWVDEQPVRLEGEKVLVNDAEWIAEVSFTRFIGTLRDTSPDLCAPCRNDLLAKLYKNHDDYIQDMRKRRTPNNSIPAM